MNLEDKIYKWFDDRFKLKELLTPIIKHPAPEYAVTNPLYCLGGIAFLVFPDTCCVRVYSWQCTTNPRHWKHIRALNIS